MSHYLLTTNSGDRYDVYPSDDVQFLANLPVGYSAVLANGSPTILPGGAGISAAPIGVPSMDLSSLDPNGLANALQSLPSVLISATPTIASEVASGICALFPSLCGGSGNTSLMAQTPNAGLLTGSCPPGRVLRRVSLGRDKCVKKPHMNPLNPHALMRATRRLSGFHKAAGRVEKAIAKSLRGSGIRSPKRSSAARCGTCQKKSCSCR